MQLPPQVITDAFGQQHGLLAGAFALAFEIASGNQVPLGVNASPQLKSEFLSALAPEVKVALENGESLTVEPGHVISVLADADVQQFPGVVLMLGADERRRNLLRGKTAATCVVVPENAEELAALTQAFPLGARAHLQAGAEGPKLSKSQIEGVRWFEERYDRIAYGHFDPYSDLAEIGSGEARVCRYCGKAAPEVTFVNVSHAFPEQIGNKKLVDARECDTCNAHFAKKVDDDFAKWSLPSRSAGRIRGKRSVPTYKSKDELFRMEHVNGALTISIRQGDPRVTVDHDAKLLEMQFERQAYTPMGVYKCFVKMALAVMPEPETSECKHLKRWLLEPMHSFESFPYKPLMLFTQNVPGPLPNDKVTYILLRRKVGVASCPYMTFIVQYSNYVHQIALPMPTQDIPMPTDGETEGKFNFELRYFPHPSDTPEYQKQFGFTRLHQEDLSSPEVKRGEVLPISFSFESVIESSPAGGASTT
jgi:hypothetical protein